MPGHDVSVDDIYAEMKSRLPGEPVPGSHSWYAGHYGLPERKARPLIKKLVDDGIMAKGPDNRYYRVGGVSDDKNARVQPFGRRTHSTATRTVDVQIGTASDWVSIVVVDGRLIGLKTDGTLWDVYLPDDTSA